MPSPDQFESWDDNLPIPRSLDNDVSGWVNMWSRQSDRADLPDTSTLVKSLVSSDPDFFPKIRNLLVLACTLFATSSEHSVVSLC